MAHPPNVVHAVWAGEHRFDTGRPAGPVTRLDGSEPCQFDPSGDASLGEAKRLRRSAMRDGGEARAMDEAERAFGLRSTALQFTTRTQVPLYPVARAPSS